jgi:Arc/MetJ-type ribon-helix-helix transcriptional regulator
VSISEEDLAFLESQVDAGRSASRSAAVHAAVKSLRTRDLEAAYADAHREWRESGEDDVWQATLGDGLSDETW